MSAFIPGLELGRRFYVEAVKPILEARFPSLQYSAALSDSTDILSDPQWRTILRRLYK